MYSTFTFAAERIVEHVVARDYGAFLNQVNEKKDELAKQLAEQTHTLRTANVYLLWMSTLLMLIGCGIRYAEHWKCVARALKSLTWSRWSGCFIQTPRSLSYDP